MRFFGFSLNSPDKKEGFEICVKDQDESCTMVLKGESLKDLKMELVSYSNNKTGVSWSKEGA